MAAKTRILIVDDHPLFREGLKAILCASGRHEVVAEAGTAGDGLAKARKTRPDLALVDMSLPDRSGIDLVRDLAKHCPGTRVMIVSMHAKIDYIVRAFQAGAAGYLVKESAGDMLLKGIDHILRGDYFMDTRVSERVVKKLAGLREQDRIASSAEYDTLTPREQEVLGLLAEGLSPAQVASHLFISPKTVENHRSSIMRKLGLHGTLELVRYAARIGIIDIDRWKT